MATHLTQTVYLNGRYMPGSEAKLSIFDRGLLFADAVYEGLGVLDGKVIDFGMHMGRLQASMQKLNFPVPLGPEEILKVCNRLIAENKLQEGFVYLHITRGEADRDYVYDDTLKPNVFAFSQETVSGKADARVTGVSMKSHPDLRWKRRDIKTSNLLGQVIAKTAASRAGAYEALMVDDGGFVTEGGATSFFIIRGKILLARPVTNEILHGITRQTMLRVAEELGYTIEIRRFTLEEALTADEAFLTGAASYVEPVVEIDGQAIGAGVPGDFTLRLRKAYLRAVRSA
ncbi:D-amino acid aminotransferase [Leisingera thetidis]|uniref:D-amino acid aminotransferase n=1 Tax=Leisingera thetidis TaxID=2930199 RepID=UPI0021F78D26|nr:D-amino acid aminotransferase [Leisingera thetidis]